MGIGDRLKKKMGIGTPVYDKESSVFQENIKLFEKLHDDNCI